jgi:DNA-binding transcriptional LysR family regulator
MADYGALLRVVVKKQQRLLRIELGLAFVSLPSPAPSGIRLRELASSPLVLVVPAGHRLADHAAVTLRDFAGESLIGFPVGYGTRAVTDRAFSAGRTGPP